jgi:hypothetical protein
LRTNFRWPLFIAMTKGKSVSAMGLSPVPLDPGMASWSVICVEGVPTGPVTFGSVGFEVFSGAMC